MSTIDLRDAFNGVSLPKGIRCTGAMLLYCDASGDQSADKRDHQRLVFQCVDANDNATKQFATDPLPPGTNVNAAAAAFAGKVTGA
jgi:hypothetical protein